MDTMHLKGYEGSVEVDHERHMCRGKLLLITDLVTYEAMTLSELRKEFEMAVDDYIETCRALGRPPQTAQVSKGKIDATPTRITEQE
jgi:predicted HicB family RNase H-like nuclease